VSWLVTGGAGYIGSHVADAFLTAGFGVVVIDDLSTGKEEFVPEGATFVRGSVENSALLEEVFSDHTIEGVVHLAGFKFAGESVASPLTAYMANTTATVSLLHAMVNHGVNALVFSSSCSVYGDTGDALVDESFPTNPASPYGRSKLAAEWTIRDCAVAYGITHSSLRYFNVIGTRLPGVIDLSPHNIVPAVHEALLAAKAPRINGNDYATPDGTCVRDYVDVGELADAHLAAAQRIISGETLEPVYNLGSESGLSVKQIVETALAISGATITPTMGPRRAGDPASIVARSDLAKRDLGWTASMTLTEMIQSDWSTRQELKTT
jgi:UDP-glucose 4-epimerase